MTKASSCHPKQEMLYIKVLSCHHKDTKKHRKQHHKLFQKIIYVNNLKCIFQNNIIIIIYTKLSR